MLQIIFGEEKDVEAVFHKYVVGGDNAEKVIRSVSNKDPAVFQDLIKSHRNYAEDLIFYDGYSAKLNDSHSQEVIAN